MRKSKNKSKKKKFKFYSKNSKNNSDGFARFISVIYVTGMLSLLIFLACNKYHILRNGLLFKSYSLIILAVFIGRMIILYLISKYSFIPYFKTKALLNKFVQKSPMFKNDTKIVIEEWTENDKTYYVYYPMGGQSQSLDSLKDSFVEKLTEFLDVEDNKKYFVDRVFVTTSSITVIYTHESMNRLEISEEEFWK